MSTRLPVYSDENGTVTADEGFHVKIISSKSQIVLLLYIIQSDI
jgi:hypothetical protein